MRAFFVGVMVFLAGTIAHAEVIELEGTVKAVDAEARTISIERKTAKGTKTLELEVNKKAGDLSSVNVGDTISFSYDPGLEVVTKIGGEGKKSRKVVSANEEELARSALDTLLKAIEDNDYDGFISILTARFQAELTKQKLAGISTQLTPRMKKGYDVITLGKMKKGGSTVYLWKVSFKDGEDDTLARLVLEDEKVSGFLLQ